MNKEPKEVPTNGEISPQITALRERLKARYPDENPADDAAWDGLGVKYMDETEVETGRFRQVEEQMTELCRAYPEFAELVFNMTEHRMPLRVAIARIFSQEDLLPQEGDDDFDGYRKAWKERLEGVSKRDKQGREIDANEAGSMENIDAFCREKGLTDERKEALIDLINGHFTELLHKRISREMLEGFLKQMDYDGAVSEADRAAEIRGRNAAIEAKRGKERQAAAGDGLPSPVSGGKAGQESRSLRDFYNEGGNRTNYSEILNRKKQ